MAGGKKPAAPADASDTPKPKKRPTTNAERAAAWEEKRAAGALAAQAKGKPGRPTSFTPDVCEEIFRRLEAGETLNAICCDEHLPEAYSVRRRARELPEFASRLARARESWADALVDEMMDVARDGSKDWIVVTQGGRQVQKVDKEAVDRSKLIVSTIQWIAARENRFRFSDDATKITADSGDAATAIKQDQTVIAPDEKGPDKPVL